MVRCPRSFSGFESKVLACACRAAKYWVIRMLASAFGSKQKQLFNATVEQPPKGPGLFVLPFQRPGSPRSVLVVNKDQGDVQLSLVGVPPNATATVIGGDLGPEPGWSPPERRAVTGGVLRLGGYGVGIVEPGTA